MFLLSLPMRERGLKYAVSHSRKLPPASLPCGERGLKYCRIGSLELAIKKP